MKIRKKLQKIFKTLFQKLFNLIYGKILYNKNYNFLKKNNLNKLDEIYLDSFKYKCFKINNGRIYSDLVENLSIISENHLIPGANFQKIEGKIVEDEKNSSLVKGTPRVKKKIFGTLLSLIQDASETNYSHWLLDILPRIKIFEQNNSINEIDYFLLPELKSDFQLETLKILEIPVEKILINKKNRHIESKILFVTDHPWYKKGLVHDEMINMPKWIIVWLREKFLKKAEYKFVNKKIFIDRSDSKFNHCKIINSDEVWNFLKIKGFKKYKLTEMNFINQLGLFNNASIIIGAHGAGLSNIIFSKVGCKIIEIKPKNHSNKFFSRVSQINNLNHDEIISKDLKLNVDNKPGDIFVDINDISNLLD